MARKCSICGKGTVYGNTISHSHRKTRRSWKANLFKIRVVLPNGSKKKVYVCNKCLKSNKVVKAV